ncbi:MAG: Do family serine endopeptidase [Ignavibacteria bacterium]|jgi:serine protease Do
MRKKPIVSAVLLIGIGIIFGVALVSTFNTGGIASAFAADKEIGAKQAPVTLSPQVQALNDAMTSASKSVNATVVNIKVVTESKVDNKQLRDFFKFFGSPEDMPGGGEDGDMQKSEGAGSGVIISSDGYIITNNHVVEQAKDDGITVILSDRKEYKAKLIGRDPLTDLAVIKVEASNLPVAHIGNSDEVVIGEMVIAVGNPLGLNSTVTSGIVSAIGRGALGLNRDRYAVENFIQTDAAINPGNSGGGLFNLRGSLIGINSAIATRTGGYMGYGFAIPANLMKAVALDIIEDGKVDRGYIGISLRPVDEVSAKSLKLDKVAGALVDDIIKDSPAEKAGIEAGDVILELDGKPVNSSNDLQSLVAQRRAGDKVNLKIWRDGKSLSKSVVLKKRDDATVASNEDGVTGSASKEDESTNGTVSFKDLGFTVAPLTEKVKTELNIEDGVLITKVEPYSHASERGLFPGFVIVKAEKQSISKTGQINKIIKDRQGEVLKLQVKSKDGSRLIFLEIPKKS